MKELRIQYFSQPDLVSGRYLFKVQNLLEHLDENNILSDINDAIELYNAKRWIDSGASLTTWTDSEKNKYKTIVKTIVPQQLGVFCSKINDDNIIEFIDNLSFQYPYDFWSLFVTFKVYNRISPKKFETILNSEKNILKIILQHKELVINYDKEISNKIRSSYKYATLIVSNYLEYHDEKWQPLYFPSTLSNNDKTNLIDNYINSKNPNPNIIELISISQSTNDLPLSDFTLYAAKKKYNEQRNQLFKKTPGIKFTNEVSFTNEVEYTSTNYSNNRLSYKYSLSWLEQNLDYATILNNFVHVFQFTDSNFRCSFLANEHLTGIYEKLFSVRGKKEYPIDIVYEQFDAIFLMLTQKYELFLQNKGITLLEVLKWFFESYLVDEFATTGFELNIPSKHTTYLEKCTLLAPSIERILKQFKMLVENGYIDNELLSISSNPIFYKDIPSFVNDKYIYRVKKELDYVFNCMFSDQSILLIDTEKSSEFDTCYEFMNNVNVKIDEFDMGRVVLDKLINEGYVITDSNGYLKPVSKKLFFVKDLFYNNVSCYYYQKGHETEIKNLKDNNKIKFGSTLFSIPEQKYLNYLFNKSEFSNGLDLRNKYLHGSHAPASAEDEHRINYYIFLRMLIFMVIKINEEFCLKEELDK